MAKGTQQRTLIIGRLGTDPDIFEKGEHVVAKLNIAVTEVVKKKETDEWQDMTTWLKVTFFNKDATFAKSYLKKGDSVYVEAKLRPSKWQDEKGEEHHTLDIIGTHLQQVGARSKSDNDSVPEGNVDEALSDIE